MPKLRITDTAAKALLTIRSFSDSRFRDADINRNIDGTYTFRLSEENLELLTDHVWGDVPISKAIVAACYDEAQHMQACLEEAEAELARLSEEPAVKHQIP
jgi:hypothetical protein